MFPASVHPRQFLVRLDEGRELAEAVESVCRDAGIGAGWVRAFGTLRGARLASGADASTVAEIDGVAELVSFDGSIAMVGDRPILRGAAVVAFSAAGIPTTRGGTLVEARCDDVEAVVVAFDGIEARREPTQDGSFRLVVAGSTDERPGDEPAAAVLEPAAAVLEPAAAEPKRVDAARPVERKRSRPPTAGRGSEAATRRAASAAPTAGTTHPPKSAKPAPASAWAKVAAASKSVQDGILDDDGEIDVDELERGDTILHPSLDKCSVVAVINDDAIKVRLPNGSVRKLMMRSFRLIAEPGEERTFKIVRK